MSIIYGDIRVPGTIFRGPFFLGTIFPGNHFSRGPFFGDHFSCGPFFRGSFKRVFLETPFSKSVSKISQERLYTDCFQILTSYFRYNYQQMERSVFIFNKYFFLAKKWGFFLVKNGVFF